MSEPKRQSLHTSPASGGGSWAAVKNCIGTLTSWGLGQGGRSGLSRLRWIGGTLDRESCPGPVSSLGLFVVANIGFWIGGTLDRESCPGPVSSLGRRCQITVVPFCFRRPESRSGVRGSGRYRSWHNG